MTVQVKATQTTVGVSLLQTGTVSLPRAYLFRGEGGGAVRALGWRVPPADVLRVPVRAVLVEHPREGAVLVDTGLHADVATDPARNLGRIGAAVVRGVRLAPGEDLAAQLGARGIDPASIGLVVMTHLHPDHTSAMSAFPRATFAVERREWAAATGRLAALNAYLPSHLPPPERVRLLDVGDGEPYEGLRATLDLFGDGSVRLVSTPGHTAGHLSVLLRTDAGEVFYLADAVYTLRNLREDRLPWRTHDDDASRASMEEIRSYAETHPDTALVPCHDADAAG